MATPITNTVYEAVVRADAGREGRITSDDGRLDLALAKPPGLGGTGTEPGTNPEQLFAAGYAGCFHAALLANARREKIDVSGSSVTARVAIGTVEPKGYGLAVTLDVDLPGVAAADATKLLELAHDACPYSRATRGNILVEVRRADTSA